MSTIDSSVRPCISDFEKQEYWRWIEMIIALLPLGGIAVDDQLLQLRRTRSISTERGLAFRRRRGTLGIMYPGGIIYVAGDVPEIIDRRLRSILQLSLYPKVLRGDIVYEIYAINGIGLPTTVLREGGFQLDLAATLEKEWAPFDGAH